MSFKRLLLVALLAAAGGTVGRVGDGARASARASCGPATAFKGAPILQLGPVRVAGFSSQRCAWLRLGCGPNLGGYQAALSLQLEQPPTSPIVLRATGSAAVKFRLVGSTTPAPKVPRCLPARSSRAAVSLEAPDAYYVLFVFAPRIASFQLTTWRRRHRLGTAVLACRA
jgi:hypothetical protein